MLSLSLAYNRIFFVQEMKFPYIKDISHTEKMRVKSYPIIYKSMEPRIITAPMRLDESKRFPKSGNVYPKTAFWIKASRDAGQQALPLRTTVLL